MVAWSKGAAEIAGERRRQIEDEGWDYRHDDAHRNGELLAAARCYAWAAEWMEHHPGDRAFVSAAPVDWPWLPKWWKPTNDPIGNLVKAGALIAAEIDRLRRVDVYAANQYVVTDD